MKQTAVEQIFAEIKAARNDSKFWNDSMLVDWLLESEENFKSTEKQQIKDAFGVGCQVESTRLIGYHEMSEQYFNKTYGGNK